MPGLIFVSGDHGLYSEISARVMKIFRSYTPLVEALSLDEAFLDVTGSQRLHGDAVTIAQSIRDDVRLQERLSCCVGVAAVKFMSKLASPRAKPVATRESITPGPGVLAIHPGEELQFLHPLPLRALWGVGPATMTKLDRLGISTIGELASLPLETITATVGQASGQHLHSLANGIDERVVIPDSAAKSVSHEETFAEDLVTRDDLDREIMRLGDAVARRLRVAGTAGRTVNLKVRYSDFRSVTRARTLATATDSARTIVATARELMAKLELGDGVRLVGVGVSSLGGQSPQQLALDDEPEEELWGEAERAIDEIRDRFGSGAIGPATLANQDGLRIKRQGDTQWGPSDPE